MCCETREPATIRSWRSIGDNVMSLDASDYTEHDRKSPEDGVAIPFLLLSYLAIRMSFRLDRMLELSTSVYFTPPCFLA